MNDNTIDATSTSPSRGDDAFQRPSDFAAANLRITQGAFRSSRWEERSKKWRKLMVAAQSGESRAYEQLLRELDLWLRRYYARRLPHSAADDARQEVLLAIHANRDAYAPSRPFGPWVKAIARYKLIDRFRDFSRFAAATLNDGIMIEDHGAASISAIVVDDLLNRLKPAQARAIRLVKLQGISVEGASDATGQSAALIRVNIHRGLKKLAVLTGDAIVPPTASNSSKRPSLSANQNISNPLRPMAAQSHRGRMKKHAMAKSLASMQESESIVSGSAEHEGSSRDIQR